MMTPPFSICARPALTVNDDEDLDAEPLLVLGATPLEAPVPISLVMVACIRYGFPC